MQCLCTLLISSCFVDLCDRYLFDKPATQAAHDAEGWFRTGDIARREGNYYFIVGRASVDIIKSGGYKIGAPEVERACLELACISEAAVVGVEDEEYGQRVGAIVTLAGSQRHSSGTSGQLSLDLQDLRSDLRKTLPSYKLPTLLHIAEGELPKGQTGKVQKKDLGPRCFPVPGWQNDPNVQVWKQRTHDVQAKL